MKPKAPAPPPVQRMPSPDDPDMQNAAKVKMADEQRNRKGRASTDLTGNSAYSRTTLG